MPSIVIGRAVLKDTWRRFVTASLAAHFETPKCMA